MNDTEISRTFRAFVPSQKFLMLAQGLFMAGLLCALGSAGAAEEQVEIKPRIQPAPTRALAKPCDDCIPGVINFAEVSNALWRGAQPNAEGFKALEARGLKTVINFRHDHDDLPLLKGTRLKYLRIPSFAFHPTEAHLVTFLKVMENPDNWPVYIHCAEGRDRTGYNAAAYRMLVEKWSVNDAILEMNAFHFNKIWIGNPGFLKDLKMESLKAKLLAEPKPSFLAWQD